MDVTDPGNGCVISQTVTINTHQVDTITISGNDMVCQGTNGDLSVEIIGSGGPYDFTISGPGGPYNINGITSSPYAFLVMVWTEHTH